MKIFLSYRFTGEDPQELSVMLGKIISVLRGGGSEVYCSIEDESWFREQKRTNREIMEHAFAELDTADIIFAFVRSDEKSEGMLVELGYCIGKRKKFALALKKGIKTTSIAEMADTLIEFDDIADLCDKLSKNYFFK